MTDAGTGETGTGGKTRRFRPIWRLYTLLESSRMARINRRMRRRERVPVEPDPEWVAFITDHDLSEDGGC